ncbi:MAG: SUF system NifU family Fe-S cluster assembly protein [bacterium]|nr:SUF system NifU family Fe-S cluster assembly protein [bacterium]
MDIYSEIILDHYKHPHHHGLLSDVKDHITVHNPLCGDTITIEVMTDPHDRIENVGFESTGCAISTATMSMLSDRIIGKTCEDVIQMTPEDIQSMLGVTLSPSRIKCAILGQEAVVRSLEHKA